ncbi:NUDIX hydrolase [Niveispirillum fermenti]|uniref:NUDIX hydrolase n=2 Tax=Niveispirillum fermenti TaxID=1233113 RepID=UPI003A85B557
MPFRIAAKGTQVMLVTSRETRRWILPKGWIKKKLTPDAMAAREAFEEAGVLGRIASCPIGDYHYLKRMPDGAAIECDVAVYLLEVTRVLDTWPEMDQRERRWMRIDDAAALISDGELVPLLRRLAQVPYPAAL